ncbi:lipoate--protein ligase family protein [Enteractinococcus coprophilus]|uniref:Lipoate-protein ligase A n=1 Tax=Enteractinococcus coprophilus TaxID=1027633 RepID=A0A543AMQ0_9MICC|nr:lipoate--protein ligase family protein [Enteractinococcus coprophilus]TQL73839.1 lipoate-protein ligase A [Enteractinococcus coprophilus]
MTSRTLTWVEQEESLGAEENLAYSTTLLRAVQRDRLEGPLVRIYRPEPTVSFGQQDVRMTGYNAAQQRSRQHGFKSMVRKVGGRAAAYHRGSLLIDHIQPADHAMVGFKSRFEYFGALFTNVLTRLGVQAAVGEIPGEYCAGEYSVHGVLAPNLRIKLAGTAQRVVKGAWLFSTSLIVQDAEPIRNVLTDVYEALGIEFDPQTAGAVEDGAAGVTVDDVIDELQWEYEHEFLSGGLDGADTFTFAPMLWDELLDRVPQDSSAA